MKKIVYLVLLSITIVLTGGCFGSTDLEGANIYTTVYPISFITEKLYGEHSTINTIYPSGADINTYELTDKQVEEYSQADLFIYNGLTDEKEITKEFINNNKNLLIIDVSYGLKYTHGLEELWLSPNNFLMLAKNIKENLIEYVDNKYLSESITEKYKELEENVSKMDADLRNIATTAVKEKKSTTLVVSSNVFKFLENYGFTVISLEDENNLTANNLNAIKSNFKNSSYDTIIMKKNEEKNELIDNLVNDYNAKIVYVDTLTTLSDDNKNNNKDFYSITQEYIDNIRNIVLK